MKNVRGYRKSASAGMLAVMSVYIFSGFGVFCVNHATNAVSSFGLLPLAAAITESDHDDRTKYGTDKLPSESHGEPSSPCCKKQRKCPPIPRAAVTSHHSRRIHEGQFEGAAASWHSLTAIDTQLEFTVGGDRPFEERWGSGPFFWSQPLARASVLLI